MRHRETDTVQEPVTPDTVTVLGYRITQRNPEMWTGLDFSRAVYPPGNNALLVPWKDEDEPDYSDEKWFRVRPLRWRSYAGFARAGDGWVIVRAA